MTTAAYRQASTFDATKFAIDPDNRLLWRMNRRRLDVEAWRDAMMAACGNLDRQIGGPPLALTDARNNRRRTLYAKIDRSDPDDMLRLFDFPDSLAHVPDRVPTTTGSATTVSCSIALSWCIKLDLLARPLGRGTSSEYGRNVRRAYRQLFAREPSAKELRLGVEYPRLSENRSRCPMPAVVRQYAHALLGSNEFLFVD